MVVDIQRLVLILTSEDAVMPEFLEIPYVIGEVSGCEDNFIAKFLN